MQIITSATIVRAAGELFILRRGVAVYPRGRKQKSARFNRHLIDIDVFLISPSPLDAREPCTSSSFALPREERRERSPRARKIKLSLFEQAHPP